MNIDKVCNNIYKDKDMSYWQKFLEFISAVKPLYFYGAGMVAQCFYTYCQEKNIHIDGIIVSHDAVNITFCNLPVLDIADLRYDCHTGVILATNMRLHDELLMELKHIGFNGHIYRPQYLGGEYGSVVDKSCCLPEKNVCGEGYFTGNDYLDRLGKNFHTDKASNSHNYLHKYESFLVAWRNKEFTILELGVYKGSSLAMWGAYFSQAQIIGVDIDENCKKYAGDNRQVLIRDLANVECLQELYDLHPALIIDDASHLWSHQIKALFVLFESLPSGGIYILEDLETSFSSYRFLNYDDALICTYDLLSAISEVVTSHEYLQKQNNLPVLMELQFEIEQLAMQIDMISFIHGSCIIIKR